MSGCYVVRRRHPNRARATWTTVLRPEVTR